MIVFTLCSNNYLAQAKSLGDSLAQTNPDYRFIIGLVDKISPEIDYTFFQPYDIWEVAQVPLHDRQQMLSDYNIVEFNTAVKPFYFQEIFRRYPEVSHVIYLDPDIFVYQRFTEIENLLESYDFLLTPHLLYPQKERMLRFETLVLNVGIYNLGFLAIKNTEIAGQFLDWWADRLRDHCLIDFERGLFVDQIWANYLPIFFDRVKIIKSPGYNMGYWNFHERKLAKKNHLYFVNEDHLLVFFHFSNYNPEKPQQISKWLEYGFEDRPDLEEIYAQYQQYLLRNQYQKLSQYQPLLQFAETHPHLNKPKNESSSSQMPTKPPYSEKKTILQRIKTKLNNLLWLE